MKLNAMSPIGYAIVTIIIIGFGMIISAPMLISNKNEETPSQSPSYNQSNDNIEEVERRLNARIDEISNDKYICTIEGGLNDDGIVVPIDSNNPPAKFVFVCEYKK